MPGKSFNSSFNFMFFHDPRRSELIQVDPTWSEPDWRSELIRSDFCTCLKQRTLDLWEVSSSSAPEWTRQAWMEPCFATNGLYFCFMLDALLMTACILVSALGIGWYYEYYTSLCHNVTQIVTWPITSYGGSLALRAPINRFICQEKLVSFEYWNWKTHPLI